MATQTQHPWRATARTIIQVIVTGAATVPLIVQAIGDDAPEWLVPILAGAVVVAGVITRIMAIPRVDAILDRLGLSAEPVTVQHDEPPSRLDRMDGVGRHSAADVDDTL